MDRILFVTGRLANPSLKKVLEEMKPDFSWRIAELEKDVAALMTTTFIKNHLKVGKDFDFVMIPGLCFADEKKLSKHFGVSFLKGPKDLLDIPEYFGRKRKRDYGDYSVKIFAEIVNAPFLKESEILEQARYYRKSGADVIDVGCVSGKKFKNLFNIVSRLKEEGFMVSIDTFDEQEILEADDAGADFVLSLNSKNIKIAERLDLKPVVIPDDNTLESLEKNISFLKEIGIDFIVDPILEPLNFGFSDSLLRFYEVRKRHKDFEILMGLGNITELLDSDSIGVNMLLLGIVTELEINYVLTTEVSQRAWGSVRELDVARRIFYYSKKHKVLPKGIDSRLIALKDEKLKYYKEEDLKKLQKNIKDENFRIFLTEENICVFNSKIFVKGKNISEIFRKLKISEGSHAFYLGKELAKAEIALKLKKNYFQEQNLDWGYLSQS